MEFEYTKEIRSMQNHFQYFKENLLFKMRINSLNFSPKPARLALLAWRARITQT